MPSTCTSKICRGPFLASYNLSKLPTPVKLVLTPTCFIAGGNALDLVNAVKSVWEPTVWKAFGHTVQNANVSIIQGWEDKKTGTPAKAQMRATLQIAKVFSTKTIALTLKITGRKVSIIPTM